MAEEKTHNEVINGSDIVLGIDDGNDTDIS